MIRNEAIEAYEKHLKELHELKELFSSEFLNEEIMQDDLRQIFAAMLKEPMVLIKNTIESTEKNLESSCHSLKNQIDEASRINKPTEDHFKQVEATLAKLQKQNFWSALLIAFLLILLMGTVVLSNFEQILNLFLHNL